MPNGTDRYRTEHWWALEFSSNPDPDATLCAPGQEGNWIVDLPSRQRQFIEIRDSGHGYPRPIGYLQGIPLEDRRGGFLVWGRSFLARISVQENADSSEVRRN